MNGFTGIYLLDCVLAVLVGGAIGLAIGFVICLPDSYRWVRREWRIRRSLRNVNRYYVTLAKTRRAEDR